MKISTLLPYKENFSSEYAGAVSIFINGINLNIYEGEKSLVERINVLGNTVTNEDVIRGELLVDEGDPYSKLKFDQSVSRLKGRNIFKLESLDQAKDLGNAVTSYSIYLRKNYKYRIKKLAWKASKIVRHLFD